MKVNPYENFDSVSLVHTVLFNKGLSILSLENFHSFFCNCARRMKFKHDMTIAEMH